MRNDDLMWSSGKMESFGEIDTEASCFRTPPNVAVHIYLKLIEKIFSLST